MKKKMFAMLTISFMVMAAFGAVAVFAEDTAADDSQRVINEASGTVNYIPDVINVSVGGTASFIPTVNWIKTTAAIDGYTVTLKMDATCTGGTTSSIGLFDGETELTNTTGMNFGTINVKGISTGGAEDAVTLEVKVTATIAKDSASIELISEVRTIKVYVYDAVSITGATVSDCYFGEEYTYNLKNLVTAGSGEYAIVVDDMGTSYVGDNLNGLPSGLYMLGTTIKGLAYASNFNNTEAEMKVIIIDIVTGASKETTVTMNLQIYKVTVEYDDSAEEGVVVKNGDNLLVKQGEAAKFTYNLTGAPDGATITFGSEHLEFSNESNPVTVTPEIIGDHLVMVSYEANGHVYNALTFTMSVVYNGIDFIVPEPGMVVTLTG